MRTKEEIQEELDCCLEYEKTYINNGADCDCQYINIGWVEALEFVLKEDEKCD